MKNTTLPYFMTISEAARFLGMSVSRFYELGLHKTFTRHSMPGSKIGGNRSKRIATADLIAYAESIVEATEREQAAADKLLAKHRGKAA